MSYSDSPVSIVSQCLVVADSNTSSSIESLRLSVSDLLMITAQYVQRGCLFAGKPPNSISDDLKSSLSKTLSIFPPLAGRLSTDSDTGHISITCSNAGALFVHAKASSILLNDIVNPGCSGDVPEVFKEFFALNGVISFDGDLNPITAVQVTELADSFFIGCSVNHAVVDDISLWQFFNTFAEISRSRRVSLPPPCFSRDNVLSTDVAIRFPGGRPRMKFIHDQPTKE